MRTEPLVLYAGSIFNRRRLPAAIAAFAAAARDLPEARFVIAGANRTYPAQDLRSVAADAGVADRVELRDYVSDAELDALYARARAFIFLSEYEGFGLTPLEALGAGVTPIVLDTEVAREIYGEAACYVSPLDDVRQAAEALRSLLAEPESRPARLAHARDVLARYSWDTAAAATLGAIEGVAG